MKTKAAILYQVNRPFVIEKIIVPELKTGQVLVDIAYSGICGSQINEIKGLKGEDKFLPHTLGHEGSGTVEAVGPGVKKVKRNNKVVLTWIKGNGIDAGSSIYEKEDGSKINSGPISTFMTKAVISENRVVKIPNEMPLREAALLGCAIPTGSGIILNTIKLSRGDTIAIFGMGGIGLSALIAAKLKQASIIIAVDVVNSKLDHALQLGATHAINAKKEDVLPKIYEITKKLGVDYAIECAGKKESMEIAFKSVSEKSGRCIIAGNLSYGQTVQIDPFDLIKGKCIAGTWGGETDTDRDIPIYVDLAISGKLDLSRLICRVYGLNDINKAIEYMEQRAISRVLVKMDKQ